MALIIDGNESEAEDLFSQDEGFSIAKNLVVKLTWSILYANIRADREQCALIQYEVVYLTDAYTQKAIKILFIFLIFTVKSYHISSGFQLYFPQSCNFGKKKKISHATCM